MNQFRFTIILLLIAGCSKPQSEIKTLTLATTTSTQDSGLLDVLVPLFENETDIEVKVIAGGSGQALELGRRGDADVLLTHAPDAEKQFVAEGFGEERRLVMYNDFILVGPQEDPAHAKSKNSIAEAFRQVADAKSPFVSRGDESGTHMKEKAIWKQADIQPKGDWYIQSGAGMAEALRMANQKRAYTLSDRATFLAQTKSLDLAILSEGDPLLHNPYSVIVVSSKKHPEVHHAAAIRFAEFLFSPTAQKAITDFGNGRFGQPLFHVIRESSK